MHEYSPLKVGVFLYLILLPLLLFDIHFQYMAQIGDKTCILIYKLNEINRVQFLFYCNELDVDTL